jgi:hypothetical protein
VSKIHLKTKYRDIDYEEDARAYSKHVSADSQMVTRTLAVAWANTKFFEEDMLGWSENLGGSLSRKPPDQHPANKRLWCVDCQMVGKEGQHQQDPLYKGMPQYDMALYQCTYRNLPYRVIPDEDMDPDLPSELDRYVIRRPKFSFEMQKIPGVDVVINIPGLDPAKQPYPLGEVPVQPITLIGLEYTVIAVPLELVPDVLGHANTINAADFDDSIQLGEVEPGPYSPRKVLFSGFDASKIYTDIRGTAVADLVYMFAVRSHEWNYFPSPKDNTWLKAFRRSDPTKSIFETSDFNDLFDFSEV